MSACGALSHRHRPTANLWQFSQNLKGSVHVAGHLGINKRFRKLSTAEIHFRCDNKVCDSCKRFPEWKNLTKFVKFVKKINLRMNFYIITCNNSDTNQCSCLASVALIETVLYPSWLQTAHWLTCKPMWDFSFIDWTEQNILLAFSDAHGWGHHICSSLHQSTGSLYDWAVLPQWSDSLQPLS